MSDLPSSIPFPRPFYDQWGRTRRPAAHALWHWHSALAEPSIEGGGHGEGDVEAFFDEERTRAEAGDPMRLVPEAVWTDAYDACAEYDLDRSLLGAQVEAARVLHGDTRFETRAPLKTFVRLWAVPHGRLLAGLAGADASTQLRWVDELSRGFFYLGRLVTLPRDVRRNRLFVPMDSLEQAGVTVDQLREGRVDEGVRRLLWKESVRIRDALAQGRPLIDDLSLRRRYALKRFWFGGLELLNELERRDFDLWTEPLALSWFRRVQVYLKTLLGRTRPGR